ncbi:MAG: alpha/beta hydrolase [Actinomycetia bacterium]|nr:alpha/beta hydrolase [Actinomycetes bacterium]
MTRELVLVHGRAQQDKDADELKAQWLTALRAGLAKSGLELPIPESDVRFPYYGDTLRDLVEDVPADQAAAIRIRGEGMDAAQRDFTRAIVEEIKAAEGLTREQLIAVSNRQVVARGPVQWPWVQAVLEALDRFVPGASAVSIALFTHDVYHYLRHPGVRDRIDTGVRKAITPGVPAVVVGHSLGSVVAYNILRRDGAALGWEVPLYVSVGSPLGISEIRRALRPVGRPACVERWFNAMDDRDVVALFPLDGTHFPITPPIENWTGVRNSTSNRHGIAGYLDDAQVARRVHDALLG